MSRIVSSMRPGERKLPAARLLVAFVVTIGVSAAAAGSPSTPVEQAGHTVGSTLHEIGHGARDVGREIGQGAAEVGRAIGHTVKDVAVTIGEAARDASRALVRGLKGE